MKFAQHLAFIYRLAVCAALAGFALAGCASGAAAPPLATVAIEPPAGGQTAPPEASATVTPSALPSQTPAPTATFTPSQTPTATATLFPMSIAALRQRAYPASPITREEELPRGANYRRFYASYLSDGLRIYALLTIPDGETPPGGWPAIVFNHGYIPPAQYRTTERYIAYVDSLARSGYVVFRIDYRGHDRSEGQARGAYSDPGYTVDVLNALAALQADPLVDAQRVGMWGHSMGGFLTLRAMVIAPQIKAGVIWAGVVASYPDLLTRWRRVGGDSIPTPLAAERGWRGGWAAEFGAPDENPVFWSAVSANDYLADLSGPLQLHHGTADESVPLEFSELLAGELQAVNKPYELYIYPGDNHNLSGSFSLAMQRTIAFFDRYLK